MLDSGLANGGVENDPQLKSVWEGLVKQDPSLANLTLDQYVHKHGGIILPCTQASHLMSIPLISSGSQYCVTEYLHMFYFESVYYVTQFYLECNAFEPIGFRPLHIKVC